MLNRWAHLDRPEYSERAIASFRNGGTGVAFLGEIGVGKSELATEVARSLQGPVVRGYGSALTQQQPLGVFNSALRVRTAPHPAQVLEAARAVLEDYGPNVVVVVDDVHYADRLSALLLTQLTLARTARIIVTGRSRSGIPASISALWRDRHLLRFDVSPFTYDETAAVLSRVLGGNVETSTVHAIHSATSGNPLAIRALVASAQSRGLLRLTRTEYWRLTDANDQSASGLIDATAGELLADALQAAKGPGLFALQLVAFATPLPLGAVLKLAGELAAEHAEEQGWIVCDGHGTEVTVRPSHPLLAAAARASTPDYLADSIRQRIADELSNYGDTPLERIRRAQLIAHAPSPDQAHFLAETSADALSLANLDLAKTLSHSSISAADNFPARLVSATCASWQGAGDNADAQYCRAIACASNTTEVLTASIGKIVNLFWGLRRPHQARAALLAAQKEFGRAASGALSSLGSLFTLFQGDPIEALKLSRPLISEGADGQVYAQALATAALSSALVGKAEDALGYVAQWRHVDVQADTGLLFTTVQFAHCYALTSMGCFNEAERAAEECITLAEGHRLATAFGLVIRGRARLARGDALRSAEDLNEALATLRDSSPGSWQFLAALFLARSYAQLGSQDKAIPALEIAEATFADDVAVYSAELDLTRVWVRAVAGECKAPAEQLLRAAATAARAGLVPTLWETTLTATRLRINSVKFRESLAPTNPFESAIATLCDAVELHDCSLASRSAQRLQELGAPLLAADAHALAASLAAQTNDARGSTLASAAAHSLAPPGQRTTPAFAALPPLPVLSAREREIASLISQGMSNRQIADKLVLSNRTVENYVYRLCKRLNLRDRSDLQELIATTPQRQTT